jgi:hypothetical protein
MDKQKLLLALLFFSTSILVIVPILGIFPLLLYIQGNLIINQNRNKDFKIINTAILMIIVLVASIFSSSLTVYSDTQIYLNVYQELSWNELFNLPFGNGLEFVTFLLAYPIYYLSNGSSYFFLLNHSFIINFLIVFVVAPRISQRYYPLLLIIVFSSFWYYYQVFLMRQVLSLAFLMAAIATLESKIVFWVYCALSFFSHLSSLPYLVLVIAFKRLKFKKTTISNDLNLKKLKNSRRIKILFLVIVSIVGSAILLRSFNFLQIASFFSLLLNSFGIVRGAELIDSKAESYYNEEEIGGRVGAIFIISFILILMVIFYKKYQNYSIQSIVLIPIFISQFILGIVITITPGIFTIRILTFFFVFQGFFYALATEEENSKVFKGLVWGFAFLSVTMFIRFLIIMPSYPTNPGSLVFFEGKPLQTNLYDYLIFLVNAQINY